MNFDRWAIVEGWYWWLIEHYNGMDDPNYARWCKITTYFSPGIAMKPSTEQAQEVYDNLCRKHHCTHA